MDDSFFFIKWNEYVLNWDFDKMKLALLQIEREVWNKDVVVLELSKSGALHTAAMFGNCEMVSLLLELGLNVNSKLVGRTPLHAAAAVGNNAEVIELLLEQGADWNARDLLGKRPNDVTPTYCKISAMMREIEENGLFVHVLIKSAAKV